MHCLLKFPIVGGKIPPTIYRRAEICYKTSLFVKHVFLVWTHFVSYIKKRRKNGKVYLSEVESKRIDGKVVTKHIRYIGKEVDGEAIISTLISDIEVKQVKVYAPLMILNHIAQEIDLPSLLGEYSDEILSMVYAHCLDYKSVNHMPSWFKRTDLNMILDIYFTRLQIAWCHQNAEN